MNGNLSSQGSDAATGLRLDVGAELHAVHLSDSLQGLQAIRLFDAAGAASHNPKMETNAERRRRKLTELCTTYGSLGAVAEKSLLNTVYLDQIIKGALLPPKRGDGSRTPRTLGDSAARAIEVALSLERGWFDNDHTDIDMSPRELQMIGYFRELDQKSQTLVIEYVRDAAARQAQVQEQIAQALQRKPEAIKPVKGAPKR